MIAKHQRWNIAHMETIAKIRLAQYGREEDVRVEFIDGDLPWIGMAFKRRGGVRVIQLASNLPIEKVDFVFWHEVAHHCLHPLVERTMDAPIVTVRQDVVAAAIKVKPNDEWMKRRLETIYREEDEADALALQLRTDYERYGSTLMQDALGIGRRR